MLLLTALEEDDVRILEFMNPKRNTLTGSDAANPAVEDYTPERKPLSLFHRIVSVCANDVTVVCACRVASNEYGRRRFGVFRSSCEPASARAY